VSLSVAKGLIVLPCLDSEERADCRRRDLDLPRDEATRLGLSALSAIRECRYRTERGAVAELEPALTAARAGTRSIPPGDPLPVAPATVTQTRVCVSNETTMGAARRLLDAGEHPLALNFANGVAPGGGFLAGARAQEEGLCRSSALYATLAGDPMYDAHRRQGDEASSDWVILSPDVPFFRTDSGTALEAPWPLSVITCAAPVAARVGQPRAADLLRQRIGRVLAVAHAFGYEALVLGAWGCGAFGNDPVRTAHDFREALQGPFAGAFREVVFAIADWSAERRFLGPFRDTFASRHLPGVDA
jgi:uncharacterized protein (TIGR02452 family)